MNTATNYLTLLSVFLLFVAPSLYGIAHDRRIDRQIREAWRNADRPAGAAEFTTAP